MASAPALDQLGGFTNVRRRVLSFLDQVIGIHQGQLRFAFVREGSREHEVLRFLLQLRGCGPEQIRIRVLVETNNFDTIDLFSPLGKLPGEPDGRFFDEFFDLFPVVGIFGENFGDGGFEIRGVVEQAAYMLDQIGSRVDQSFRSLSGHGFNPAYAGCDRSFGHDLE